MGSWAPDVAGKVQVHCFQDCVALPSPSGVREDGPLRSVERKIGLHEFLWQCERISKESMRGAPSLRACIVEFRQ